MSMLIHQPKTHSSLKIDHTYIINISATSKEVPSAQCSTYFPYTGSQVITVKCH